MPCHILVPVHVPTQATDVSFLVKTLYYKGELWWCLSETARGVRTSVGIERWTSNRCITRDHKPAAQPNVDGQTDESERLLIQAHTFLLCSMAYQAHFYAILWVPSFT